MISVDGGPPVALGAFLADNPDLDPEDVAALRGLAVGAAMVLGGGAWASFTMRVSGVTEEKSKKA